MVAQLQHAPAAACPGCLAAPVREVVAPPAAAQIALSLPGIHCQGCIATVERGLSAQPGVKSARVNLTLKRALVEAAPEVTAADLIEALAELGHEAHELLRAEGIEGVEDRQLITAREGDQGPQRKAATEDRGGGQNLLAEGGQPSRPLARDRPCRPPIRSSRDCR